MIEVFAGYKSRASIGPFLSVAYLFQNLSSKVQEVS